jgi:hypothetical protein
MVLYKSEETIENSVLLVVEKNHPVIKLIYKIQSVYSATSACPFIYGNFVPVGPFLTIGVF